MMPLDAKTDQHHAHAHPAATVILTRPADCGFEVLLLLRAKAVKFAGDTWVFPGGRIDAEDYCDHPEDERAAARIAAARESKEEANLNLKPEQFHFFSHWTTPLVEKKRFATWFLLGCLHDDKTIKVDDSEIVDYQWLSPSDALDKHRNGELMMFPPAFMTLLELSRQKTLAGLIASVEKRELPTFFPNLIMKGKTPHVLLADDAGYKSGELDHNGILQRLILAKTGWEYVSNHP